MQNLINRPDIENEILHAAYEVWFFSEGFDGVIDLAAIRERIAVDEVQFEKVIDWMKVNGLIKPKGGGQTYKIGVSGIVEAERREIVSEELARKNKQARGAILSSLTDIYVQQGPNASARYEQLAESCQLDPELVLKNLRVLEDEYFYVQGTRLGEYKLTYNGLALYEKCHRLSKTIDRFEKLSALEPQPRGRAFQKFFAELLTEGGWDQAESVRTSHEEMDIIISRDREYYLVECKWEKNPIEADVIRELMGKLTNRIDVRGIAVSMSGFSQGAIVQTEQYASNRIMLLFGPADVHSLAHGKNNFTDLLNSKYREIMMHRKATYS